ncbi:GNAT family N-acetyltransferase [Jiella sp. M17.18]|uniref:GNAT family N-acetyltransferase n=1 Tax=Jiella sp. M17.18 TaxID=3234247 RepID=UPI0034DEC7EB
MSVASATWRRQRIVAAPAPPASAFAGSDREVSCAAVVTEADPLAEHWADLRARAASANFYQSYEWCSAWTRSCARAGRPEALRIVTVWEGRRLVLLWPLTMRRTGPVRVLHALGEPATQYCDLLVEASPNASTWFAKAWACLIETDDVDAVHMKHVRRHSALERLKPVRHRWIMVSTKASPYLVKTADPSKRLGLRSRSGRSRNALKRHMKNLMRIGDVTFEAVPRSQHTVAVRAALDLKARWLEARGLASAGYLHPGNENTILTLAAKGHFMIRRLRVGDETAAVEIGVLDRGHYYSMIQSYDQRFAVHSPGRLLLSHMLESDDGIETFDFLPPSLPHKTEWTQSFEGVADYVVPLTLRGRLMAAYLKAIRPRLAGTFEVLPASLRRRLSRLKTFFY